MLKLALSILQEDIVQEKVTGVVGVLKLTDKRLKAAVNLHRYIITLIMLAILTLCTVVSAQQSGQDQADLLDWPAEAPKNEPSTREAELSYEQAVQSWKTVDEISGWIGAYFQYDQRRAFLLAANQTNTRPDVYTPAETFKLKSGVCIDLTRFAAETAKIIRPDLEVKYLLITFTPVRVGNSTFRQHWVAAYKENNQWFVFADSKRPGVIAGPYENIESFITDYQLYRNRPIISYKLLEDYRKRLGRQQLNKNS